jgi:hypothetical protein
VQRPRSKAVDVGHQDYDAGGIKGGLNLIRHRYVAAAAAALGLLALGRPAAAQPADLAGAWHGEVSNLAINIVIAPDHQFTETFITRDMKTDAKGHITPFAPGVVTFVVDDWSPHSNPIDRSVTYGVKWVSPDEVILTDVNKQGEIRLLRVP